MNSRPTTPRQGSYQRDVPLDMYNASMPGSVLQHAGYQQDLNYVYSLVGELSEVLRQNREQTQKIVRGVARIRDKVANGEPITLADLNSGVNGISEDLTGEACLMNEVHLLELTHLSADVTTTAATNGTEAACNPSTNGTANSLDANPTNSIDTTTAPPSITATTSATATYPTSAVHAAQINQLQQKLTEATAEVALYKKLYKTERSSTTLLENTISKMMDMVRKYCHDKETELINTTKVWNARLQHERDVNLEMRLEHSRWQEGLGRAFNWAREALKSASEREEPFEVERAELRHENRFLRRLLGWDVEESEDEGDGEGDEGGEVAPGVEQQGVAA